MGTTAKPPKQRSASENPRALRVAVIGTRGYPSFYGGFETAVRKLAPYLAQNGFEVTVYSRPGSIDESAGDSPGITAVMTKGIESRSLSTLSYGFTSTLHALIKRPDVAVVMNVANGFWLPLLRMRGVPTLVNVDGIEWDRAKWGRVAKAVFRGGARMTARFGTELVSDAEAIAARWRSEFDRDSTFIPYGGDSSAPLPVPSGLTHRGYVLVVARFVPENTVAEFFDAVEILSSDWPVVIVGSEGYGGVFDERARSLANRFEHVSWLGHLKDDAQLHSLWQHAGAYFHGHSVGGTNPALVQAMALGSPIVARDTVYNREVLGADAMVVAPVAVQIAAMIDLVMNDPALQTRLSDQALSQAHAKYTWESVCAAYEQALRKLVRSRD